MAEAASESESLTVDPPLDVIAVGAHPDDVEIACGGTLAKLAEQGHCVGIIDLTDGEPTPGSHPVRTCGWPRRTARRKCRHSPSA